MSQLTPKQVLQKFKSKKSLESIAEKRNINLTTQQKKRVADILAEDVIKIGITKVLHVLKKSNLISLCSHACVNVDKGEHEESWYPAKGILVEVLAAAITGFGVLQFFEEFDETVLLACCKRIDDLDEMTDEELSEFSKEDLVTGILSNIYTFGLQNLFSSFSVTELKEFCETCELSVKSSSKEVLVDCLIEQKDYRTKGSKVKAEKASKKKPDLKDGIKKVDLEQWYYRNELEEFCKDNGIKRGGNKREIIKRILLFFEGDKSSKVFHGFQFDSFGSLSTHESY
jgi:hypothetical protein